MSPQPSADLRRIPSVDRFLATPEIAKAAAGAPRALQVREARALLENVRHEVMSGELTGDAVDAHFERGGAATKFRTRLTAASTLRHRRVYNATGIVLHTGIGRARLADAAVDALCDASGFAVVEVDPLTGARNQRESAVAGLLAELTGAEHGLAVNNNAAATVLMLTALTDGREVIVSRGEQVEIGGGFRMPDVMQQAGSKMVEIGATNKTHLADYGDAVTEATAAFLKVHPSNFRIQGFTAAPTMPELVALARDARQADASAGSDRVLVLEDLGSGLMWPGALHGVDEPPVQDSVDAGVDVVCFSGDKLLGGPQCGLLVGNREVIDRIRAHPLYRAFRCDKLTLAALEATLRIYRDGDPLLEIPTLSMLSMEAEDLQQPAEELARSLDQSLPKAVVESVRVVQTESFAGSGANPARPVPSRAVALRPTRGVSASGAVVPAGSSERLLERLRTGPGTPVFSRIDHGDVLLDLRTLFLEDLDRFVACVAGKFADR